MIKKIVMCAVIALILVPAGVLAAGFGGQNTGTSGQAQCLHNGENCANNSGTPGSGNQTQFRYGAQQNGITGAQCSPDGQCSHDQKRTRSMGRLHDGSCTGCKNGAVTQS